jgi:predicted GNAT superfamily acetyltransferase
MKVPNQIPSVKSVKECRARERVEIRSLLSAKFDRRWRLIADRFITQRNYFYQ